MKRLKNNDAVIIAAARSPVGKFMGALKDWSAPELAGPVIRQVVREFGFSPGEVKRFIVGNVYSAGLGQNPAKQAALQGGLSRDIMAHGVSRVCASSLQALWDAYHFAKMENEVVIAAGMESMSQTPFLLVRDKPDLFLDSMLYDGLEDAYSYKHMGELAAMLADEHPDILSREKQDLFAWRSHKRAIESLKIGRAYGFNVLGIAEGYPIKYDEGVRDPDMEKLSKLKLIFGNTITAGNASQLSDGAAALLVSSYQTAKKVFGLSPLARIVAFADSSGDPNYYTTAPVMAAKRVLAKAGLKIADMELIEANEAFADVSLFFIEKMGIDPEVVNGWGGAIAKGHPLGASGARIVTEIVKQLQFTGKRYGLAVACHGGGGAVAVIIENLK